MIVLLNLFVLVGGLAGVGWWRRQQAIPIPSHIEGTVTQGFFESAPDVGYIPRANQQVTARRVSQGSIVYDVRYTIGADSFRIVPSPGEHVADACVPVFGDSFAFGEGIQDSETLPAQLVAAGGGRIAAYNFGIGGWGPHQLLGGLASGRFQRALSCRPTVALYTMVSGHLRRLAGRDDWVEGPRFHFDADRQVVRDGTLKDGRFPRPDVLDEGYFSWRRLIGVRDSGTVGDVALAAAVFRESLGYLGRLNDRLRLHVLYLDSDFDVRFAELFARLAEQGIVLHRVEEMIPDFRDHRAEYEIGRVDGHFNARANRLIAKYVETRIIGR